MKNLSNAQRKTFVLFALFLLVLTVAAMIFYVPRQHRISRLGRELADVQQRILEIDGAVAGDLEGRGGAGVWASAKEEKSLNLISEAARKCSLTVSSVRAQPKVAFLDDNQQQIRIAGKPCVIVPVTVEMKGRYIDFVNYLTMLSEMIPVHYTAQRMHVRKQAPESDVLLITLELNLYLLT